MDKRPAQSSLVDRSVVATPGWICRQFSLRLALRTRKFRSVLVEGCSCLYAGRKSRGNIQGRQRCAKQRLNSTDSYAFPRVYLWHDSLKSQTQARAELAHSQKHPCRSGYEGQREILYPELCVQGSLQQNRRMPSGHMVYSSLVFSNQRNSQC